MFQQDARSLPGILTEFETNITQAQHILTTRRLTTSKQCCRDPGVADPLHKMASGQQLQTQVAMTKNGYATWVKFVRIATLREEHAHGHQRAKNGEQKDRVPAAFHNQAAAGVIHTVTTAWDKSGHRDLRSAPSKERAAFKRVVVAKKSKTGAVPLKRRSFGNPIIPYITSKLTVAEKSIAA